MRLLRLSCVLLISAISCLSCAKAPAVQDKPAAQKASVVFPDGWAVQVDLATTPSQHARGLMYVDDLPADRGMLFLFDTSEARPFWMKNCLISLDLIWLDERNRVVDISRQAPPCKEDPCPNYYPSGPARNVLEVQSGLTITHNLQPGDLVVFVGVPAKTGP